VANEASSVLLGMTRQLIGENWLNAREFQYAGSIGPQPVAEATLAEVGRIGDVLAERFALIGLFGVDFIIDGDQVWTLEVNPRYTASVEIVERTTGVSAIAAHAAACRGLPIDPSSQSAIQNPQSEIAPPVHGKAILFAKRPITISPAFENWALAESLTEPWPRLADISPAGTAIAPGRPIVTLFAAGKHGAEVEQRLRDFVMDIERRLDAEGD
jgi:predicted ATP-grasp superfamily ATP-dependent carboligase